MAAVECNWLVCNAHWDAAAHYVLALLPLPLLLLLAG
jgi:hypothetical protein